MKNNPGAGRSRLAACAILAIILLAVGILFIKNRAPAQGNNNNGSNSRESSAAPSGVVFADPHLDAQPGPIRQ